MTAAHSNVKRWPMLVVARDLVERFHIMLRNRTAALLPQWIADAKISVLASLCRGVASDLAAVTAALSEPWSNGQTEGQITRLKLLWRQMYGRGKSTFCEPACSVHLTLSSCTESEAEPIVHADPHLKYAVYGNYICSTY